MSAQEYDGYEGMKTDSPKSPVTNGIDDVNKGLEELSRLLHILRSKLSQVRRDNDSIEKSLDAVRPSSEMEGCPLGRQIAQATVMVTDLQRLVHELTDELLV